MRRMFSSVALLVALIMGASGVAEAGPITLRLTTTGNVATTTVVGVGNLVSFTGTIGSFVIDLSAGSSNNPGVANATLGTTNLTISNNGPANNTDTLLIEVSQTDFTSPPGPFTFDTSSTINLVNPFAGNNAQFQGFLNDNNALFATQVGGGLQVNTAPQTCTSANPCTSATSINGPTVLVPGAQPFSLTSRLLLSLSNGDPTRNANASTQLVVGQGVSVPEPATMGLFGLALLAVGSRLRRKK